MGLLDTLLRRGTASDQAVGESAGQQFTEVAGGPGQIRPAPGIAQADRAGYDSDVPFGGATKYQPGGDYPDGRAAFMQSLYNSYKGCPWLSAPIDAIARTVTAGGLQIEPDATADDDEQATPTDLPPEAKALQELLDYCNPHQDIIQLLRGTITDDGIYGDGFIELVWLLGRPVALYSLDPATMTVETDEHGTLLGYWQQLDAREAHFEPHEVIHIPMDAPKGSLYGMGVAEKALLPVTTWLFTMATIKETMRRGDPPHLHLDFPLEVQPDEVRGWRGQYQARNLGTQNIGNPITTRGGVNPTELKVGSLIDYLKILDSTRDTILSVAGVPPSKVGVIESGNLGGGTGTSQDKTFRVNTCGPIASVLLEKLNFALTREAFGIVGWAITLTDIDWRDDLDVENIRDKRLKNGLWTLNEGRADIDLPGIGDEGDVHVLADGRVVINWADFVAYSAATVDGLKAKAKSDAAPKPAPIVAHPGLPGVSPTAAPPGAAPPAPPGAVPPTKGAGDDKPPAKAAEGSPWRAAVIERYRRLLSVGDDPQGD